MKENTESINQLWICKNCEALAGYERMPDTCPCGKPNWIVVNSASEFALQKAYDCYKRIVNIIQYYMDIPENHAKLISMWILGTYTHKEFHSFPFLFINAMRGSGKTRLLNLICALADKGKITNNITEAVLFRTAADHTIIIDENESIVSKEKSTLRELLNSAYKKGSVVERMKKSKGNDGSEELVVQTFELYTPVAMANISGMEEVLSDRCLTIVLEKSNDNKKIKLLEDFDTNPEILDIKRTLESIQCSLCSVVSQKNIKTTWNNYVFTNYTTTYTTYTTLTTLTTLNKNEEKEVPQEMKVLFDKINSLNINGRNLELFFPIINLSHLISDKVDSKFIDEILDIANNSINEKKGYEYADSPDIALYELVSMKDPLDHYFLSDFLREFKEYYVSDDGDREWLNSKWMGRALRRLKLVLNSRRKSQGMEIMFDVAKAKEKCKIFKEEEKNNEEM